MVPSTAWLLRKRRGALLAGFFLWLASAICIYLIVHWFKQQPYSVPEPYLSRGLTVHAAAHCASQLAKSFLLLAFITSPILAAWLPTVWRSSRVIKFLIAGILILLGLLWVLMPKDDGIDSLMMPWVGDLLPYLGTAPTGDLLGVRPVSLNVPARIAISLFIAACTLAVICDTLATFRKGGFSKGSHSRSANLTWKQLFWLTGDLLL